MSPVKAQEKQHHLHLDCLPGNLLFTILLSLLPGPDFVFA